MLIIEYIKLAFRSIRSNMLRTVLTALIIAIGITALVGILTAIDSIKLSITTQFSSMGANTFTIRNRGMGVRMGGNHERPKVYPRITRKQAETFKERFEYPGSQVSISTAVSFIATVKYRSEKTNPNVKVMGVDETYIPVMTMAIEKGRNFSVQEIKSGSNVIILGSDVAKKLFSGRDSIVGNHVTIGNIRYRIIGTLASKGASMVSSDNQVLIPYTNAERIYTGQRNYVITVTTGSPEDLQAAIEASTALMRVIRKLRPADENSFEIIQSDKLSNILIEQLSKVLLATIIIGFITLVGAAVGLMNIMLVSVTERTREIGITKAIGATKRAILLQFLTEAVTICQLGGILGIVAGIGIGNIVSILLDGQFIIPWMWILLGFTLCFIVGVVAGIYPASKAANLDPIESLRYE